MKIINMFRLCLATMMLIVTLVGSSHWSSSDWVCETDPITLQETCGWVQRPMAAVTLPVKSFGNLMRNCTIQATDPVTCTGSTQLPRILGEPTVSRARDIYTKLWNNISVEEN